MRFGLRRSVLACLVAATAVVAVLVPGGSAGNRTAEVTFEAFPGPGEVTYGENIAYRATFTNIGGSNFTHVMFRMRVPYVDLDPNTPGLDAEAATPPVYSNCPGGGVTVTLSTGGHEWQCDWGSVGPGTPGTPQIIQTVVWQAPTLAQPGDCLGCLKTVGRFTAKEGTNDVSDPNDAFYPPGGGPDVLTSATLLSGDATGSTNISSAGGYEFGACTNALGAGSLHTNGVLEGQNTVQTTVCVPSLTGIVTTTYPGLATTILEEASHQGDQGHQSLGRSNVCVAHVGVNCGASYTAQEFPNPNAPLVIVFRIADAALLNGEKITVVYHNNNPLTRCADNPPDPNECTVSIDRSGGPVKTWTIVVKARSNGFYNW